jgi:hypothetical protein
MDQSKNLDISDTRDPCDRCWHLRNFGTVCKTESTVKLLLTGVKENYEKPVKIADPQAKILTRDLSITNPDLFGIFLVSFTLIM